MARTTQELRLHLSHKARAAPFRGVPLTTVCASDALQTVIVLEATSHRVPATPRQYQVCAKLRRANAILATMGRQVRHVLSARLTAIATELETTHVLSTANHLVSPPLSRIVHVQQHTRVPMEPLAFHARRVLGVMTVPRQIATMTQTPSTCPLRSQHAYAMLDLPVMTG